MLDTPSATDRRRSSTAFVLTFCLALTCIWQVASRYSARPFAPFQVTSADFAGFSFRETTWRHVPARMPEFTEKDCNILSFVIIRAEHGPVHVRLTHGYNMPMCMRHKGWEAELVSDERFEDESQSWRLIAPNAVTSIWTSAVIDAGRLAGTSIDIRSFAFPRIGVRDDPNWIPRGFTRETLKHPIRELRHMVRARWNGARCDLLTFLRLRQPAWVSDELLTVVAAWLGPSVGRDEETNVAAYVTEGMQEVQQQLEAWTAGARQNHFGAE